MYHAIRVIKIDNMWHLQQASTPGEWFTTSAHISEEIARGYEAHLRKYGHLKD